MMKSRVSVPLTFFLVPGSLYLLADEQSTDIQSHTDSERNGSWGPPGSSLLAESGTLVPPTCSLLQGPRSLSLPPPPCAHPPFSINMQSVYVQARPRHSSDRQVIKLDVPILSQVFHLRQPEAAQLLGVSLTSLKSACRKLGIDRWPYVRQGDEDVSGESGRRKLETPNTATGSSQQAPAPSVEPSVWGEEEAGDLESVWQLNPPSSSLGDAMDEDWGLLP
eukprot:753605-Hanusia_phi.AAC.3